MLHILLGPDDYSKRFYIDSLVKEKGADLAKFTTEDELPSASRLTETDLFSKPKVFVLETVLPQIGESVQKLIDSANHIIITLNSLDKRKKENKDLLANKKIITKEFNLPHGLELNKWIEKRVGELGGQISKPATEELAMRLGRDNTKETKVGGKVVSAEEVFSLWQAESEVKKLLAYAAQRPIELEDIQASVSENLEIDAFEIINAIGEGKKQEALNLMQEFLRADTAGDEKTAVIQLNALLSDQMRSLAITRELMTARLPDTDIIKKTGWKSGRVYVMKKIAQKLQPQKVLDTLKRLEALDQELKTSQTPPRVLLDLIVSQIF